MKKLLSLVLAVLMLALPLAVQAEEGRANCVEITFVPGTLGEALGLGELTPAVNDLLNALGFRFYGQPNKDGVQGGAEVVLQGNPVLKLDVAVNGEGAYAASNFLGEDTLAFSKDELIAVLDTMAASAAEQGATETDLAQINEMKQAVSQSFEMYSDPKAWDKLFDEDEFELDEDDFANAIAYLTPVMERAKVREATEADQRDDCDKIANIVEITMTGKEMGEYMGVVMKDLSATKFGQSFEQGLTSGGMTMDELLNEMNATFEQIDEIPMTIGLDAENELALISCKIHFKANEETSAPELDEEILVLRKTDGDVENVTVSVEATGDDSATVLVTVNVADTGDDQGQVIVEVAVAETPEDEMQTIVQVRGNWMVVEENDLEKVNASFEAAILDGETMTGFGMVIKAEDVSEEESHGSVQILPLDSESPYLTINVNVYTADAMDAVNTENAVNLLTMSEEEQEAWAAKLESVVKLESIKMIQSLPASVLSLMMTPQQQ